MLVKIHPDNPDPRQIKKVVECLKDGGIIIYPTDTVYGFGCDVNNKKAMEKLNFKPKFSFLSLVNEMVEKDFVLAQNEFNKKY